MVSGRLKWNLNHLDALLLLLMVGLTIFRASFWPHWSPVYLLAINGMCFTKFDFQKLLDLTRWHPRVFQNL